MANRYAIETVFKLIDNITGPLNNVGKAGNVVGRKLKSDFMAAEDSVNNFGNKLRTIGKYAIGAGIAAVSAGVVIATKQFIEFDDALHKAGAVFSDLDSKAPEFQEKLSELGTEARKVAAATEFNAQQAADALAAMAMAGIKTDQAIALLPKTADLATAAGIELNAAAGMAADTLGIFNLMSDDPEVLARNFERVSDIMQKSASLANQDINQVFAAMGNAGAFFNQGNQSIEDLGALIDGLASRSVKGEAAGTSIKNMMLGFSNIKTDKAAAAIEALGIERLDESGNLRNIIDLIGQLENGLKGMGDAEKNTHLSNLFGRNALIGIMDLVGVGQEALQGYADELTNSAGATAQAAAVMRNSVQNKIEVLKSGLTELGFKFVEAFQSQGVGVIEKLTVAISNFDPTPIINGVTTAANVIMWLANIFWTFRTPILMVVGAMYAYKAIMIAAVIASRAWAVIQGVVKAVTFAVTLATHGQAAALALLKTGSIAAAVATKVFAIAQGIATGATTAWSVATGILNALFVASPIGWIVLAIGALIAIIVLCVKNWDSITAAVGRAWEWIKNIASLIWDNLVLAFQSLVSTIQNNVEKVMAFITIFTGPFGFIISIVNELRNNWDSIVEAFQGEGIIGGIKRIGSVLLSGILAPVQGLLECLTWIPGLGEKAAAGAAKIQAFRDQLKGTENADASAAGAVVPSTVTANSSSSASLADMRRNQTITASTQPVTAPMTTAEQITYTQRNQDYLGISVAAEPGTRAQVTRPPASPNISLENSGGIRGR